MVGRWPVRHSEHMPRGEMGGIRRLLTTALAVLVSLLVASPALAVESAADLPPNADPVATLMVVAIGAALISAWTTYRDHHTRRH